MLRDSLAVAADFSVEVEVSAVEVEVSAVVALAVADFWVVEAEALAEDRSRVPLQRLAEEAALAAVDRF